MRRCPLFLSFSLLAAACGRPISPPVIGPLPFATDTARVERVADGVWYRYLYAPTGPWAIHVLDIDLSRCNRIVAMKGGTNAAGRTKTTQLLAGLARATDDGRVVAGVNADFFSLANGTPGDSSGSNVCRPATRLVRSGKVVHRDGTVTVISIRQGEGDDSATGGPP